MKLFPLSVFACLATICLASPTTRKNETVPEGLVFLGATSNKELYITKPELKSDFMDSLVIGCPLRFQMNLAAIETDEEVALLDTYFNATQGNSSDSAWTSAVVRVGRIPEYWASTGEPIVQFAAGIQTPWPSGAGSSPAYARYNCLSASRLCNRPPGTGVPGCFPAATYFTYNVCSQELRFICQKSLI